MTEAIRTRFSPATPMQSTAERLSSAGEELLLGREVSLPQRSPAGRIWAPSAVDVQAHRAGRPRRVITTASQPVSREGPANEPPQ